jgi:hypothetical protein
LSPKGVRCGPKPGPAAAGGLVAQALWRHLTTGPQKPVARWRDALAHTAMSRCVGSAAVDFKPPLNVQVRDFVWAIDRLLARPANRNAQPCDATHPIRCVAAKWRWA